MDQFAKPGLCVNLNKEYFCYAHVKNILFGKVGQNVCYNLNW